MSRLRIRLTGRKKERKLNKKASNIKQSWITETLVTFDPVRLANSKLAQNIQKCPAEYNWSGLKKWLSKFHWYMHLYEY